MKTNLKHKLYAELISGRTLFDWLFLLAGLCVQIVVFVLQPTNPWAIVSGIAGIFSVILCSQGKISTFFFGTVQISTYLYLCLMEHLYAEVAMNVFYFISQIYGIIVWKNNYQISDENAVLRSKTMRMSTLTIIAASSAVISAFVGFVLQRFTDDSQPYLDAFTTVPAIVAQILLISAYKQQWYFWLVIDLLSAVMWARAGNYSLMTLYIFWCFNCIYGLYNWSKLAHKPTTPTAN